MGWGLFDGLIDRNKAFLSTGTGTAAVVPFPPLPLLRTSNQLVSPASFGSSFYRGVVSWADSSLLFIMAAVLLFCFARQIYPPLSQQPSFLAGFCVSNGYFQLLECLIFTFSYSTSISKLSDF